MDNTVKTEIKSIALKLQENYDSQKLFDVVIGERLPNRDTIISIVGELRRITFPGYLAQRIWHMCQRLILQEAH